MSEHAFFAFAEDFSGWRADELAALELEAIAAKTRSQLSILFALASAADLVDGGSLRASQRGGH